MATDVVATLSIDVKIYNEFIKCKKILVQNTKMFQNIEDLFIKCNTTDSYKFNDEFELATYIQSQLKCDFNVALYYILKYNEIPCIIQSGTRPVLDNIIVYRFCANCVENEYYSIRVPEKKSSKNITWIVKPTFHTLKPYTPSCEVSAKIASAKLASGNQFSISQPPEFFPLTYVSPPYTTIDHQQLLDTSIAIVTPNNHMA